MQEPVREVYRGFEIMLLLRHRETDGLVETVVFITPTSVLVDRESQAYADFGFSKIHDPSDEAPISSQMDEARRLIDMRLRH
jgi:hypothetical protein